MTRQCRSTSYARLWRRRRMVMFTVGEARCALPYVARVVADAAAAYHDAQACRAMIRATIDHGQRAALTVDLDAALAALNRATDECDDVGVNLVDLDRGVVAFAATIHGRPVSLIWRVGAPIDGAWRDLDEVQIGVDVRADSESDVAACPFS